MITKKESYHIGTILEGKS